MWDKKRFMSLFCDVSSSLISRLSCATHELETMRQRAVLGLSPRVGKTLDKKEVARTKVSPSGINYF